jgi:hypothetical protein
VQTRSTRQPMRRGSVAERLLTLSFKETEE